MSPWQIHTAPGIKTVPSTFSNITSKNIVIELAHRLPAQRLSRDARLSWNGECFWCVTALKHCETARNLLNTAILLDRQEGTAMKLFSTSSFLALASMAIFSIAGVAQAQYGGSKPGPANSAGQSGSTGSSGASGQSSDGMDMGYVDQEKKLERSGDKGAKVPDFPVDKEGKPKKDPKYEQGGSIGPN